MIRMLIMLVIAAGAMLIGPIASGHKGYVLISMAQWTIEMSVVSLVISLLVLFFSFLALEWLIRKVLRISNNSAVWLSSRKQRKALQLTSDGMLALAAQDWRNAEKLLSKSARNSHTPELNYLVAAEAAKQQGKSKQTEAYVAQIGDAASNTLAIALTKAQLADDDTSRRAAKEELEQWHKKQPKQATLLTQLARLYLELKLWSDWLELLPSLRKYTQLPPEELDAQELNCYQHLFVQLGQQSSEDLELFWQKQDKAHKRNPELVASYCLALQQQGREPEAQALLEQMLRKTPSQALLCAWSKLPLQQPEELLLKVKKLAKKDSVEHLSWIGLTAMAAKRWDEAIHYLQQALTQHESLRDRLALAQAQEQNGQPELAIETYKRMVG